MLLTVQRHDPYAQGFPEVSTCSAWTGEGADSLQSPSDFCYQKILRRLRIWSNSNRYGSATCLFAARMTMSWENTEALYQLKLPSSTR